MSVRSCWLMAVVEFFDVPDDLLAVVRSIADREVLRSAKIIMDLSISP